MSQEVLEPMFNTLKEMHMWAVLLANGSGFKKVEWTDERDVMFSYYYDPQDEYYNEQIQYSPETIIAWLCGQEKHEPYLQRAKELAEEFHQRLSAKKEYQGRNPMEFVVWGDPSKDELGILDKTKFFETCIPF